MAGHHALEVEVPAPRALVAPAEADGAVRDGGRPRARVPHHGLGLGVLARLAEVGGREEGAGHVGVAALGEAHEEGQVGEAAGVVGEVRRLALDVELAQDHVRHRQRQRAVGARLGGQPVVGELGVVRVVRRDHDGLLALVARLGHEVRVGRARHGDVGAPHHQVGRVPPVGRLGDVGLVAPHLGRGGRQVGVPVVEAGQHPAHQGEEARARGVGGHRHRRDRREAHHPVRAPAADGVHVRGGHHVRDLVPRGPHEAALAAL